MYLLAKCTVVWVLLVAVCKLPWQWQSDMKWDIHTGWMCGWTGRCFLDSVCFSPDRMLFTYSSLVFNVPFIKAKCFEIHCSQHVSSNCTCVTRNKVSEYQSLWKNTGKMVRMHGHRTYSACSRRTPYLHHLHTISVHFAYRFSPYWEHFDNGNIARCVPVWTEMVCKQTETVRKRCKYGIHLEQAAAGSVLCLCVWDLFPVEDGLGVRQGHPEWGVSTVTIITISFHLFLSLLIPQTED